MALELHVHLSNGVELGKPIATIDELTTLVQILGRMPCSGFDENLRVYLHRDPVDFRYCMNSLSILVERAMHLNPMDSLQLWRPAPRRIKILCRDGSGFWLMTKPLEASRFIWLDNKSEVVTMTSGVLHALLDGDDITTGRRYPKQEYLHVS